MQHLPVENKNSVGQRRGLTGYQEHNTKFALLLLCLQPNLHPSFWAYYLVHLHGR